MHLFDSHCHLESPRFEPDRPQVIARATSAGVMRMVTCGSDLDTSAAEIALACRWQGLYAAVGIHPHEARSATRGDWSQGGHWTLDQAVLGRLSEMATRPKVVAIGEIGLDYHYDLAPHDVQRALLSRELALACELDLPVIIHNRESDRDIRHLVDKAPSSLRGVLHCFLADRAMAEWALARGLYIGVGGAITFKSVRYLAGIVRDVPMDRLLIETDAPYLAPHPHRGQRNEPAFVVHVVEKLAEVLDLPSNQVARRTTENACRLFGLPAPAELSTSSSLPGGPEV